MESMLKGRNRMKAFGWLVICLFLMTPVRAQKRLYVPDEWKNNSSLYKESDPNGTATWSKTRSVENDDLIIFWDNGYKKKPSELSKSDFFYVDIDDLMKKCQSFYDLEYKTLGFVEPGNTNLDKYKMMVLICHTEEWTCYGGGYDFEVNALWINPATCKPVGHSVAHEVGHSFHYMCYAEASGHNHWSSNTIGTGFHLPVGNGQTIWEQTAQWQANQSYPNLMYDQSIGVFRNSHNYSFTHEWHRYQSYWFHYYLCQHYGDIKTVAQVWNQPMTGAVDFNQSLMALKGLSVEDLYRLYFDYACRCATWDFDACTAYRKAYVGDFNYRCVLTEDGEYQVALASCPQSTGFNVIPLEVPEAGTVVTTHFTALRPNMALLDADPGEYLDGNTQFVKYAARKYVLAGNRTDRGFRIGYVALMKDGSRRYFSEDKVYGQGVSIATEDYAMTVPEGVSQLWLVVSPALKNYFQHKWDEKIDQDDMWPYRFSLEGTDIGSRATVYVAPTIDGRNVANATFTYDVSYPRTTGGDHSGVSLTIGGQAAATLGTAFQLQPSDINGKMQSYSSSGPSNGRIMFYAVNSDGKLASSGSTANGYGHWFDKSGKVCSYNSGFVFSEFNPSSLTFSLGQYPGKSSSGAKYTIRQALRYKKSSSEEAVATFVFNITIGASGSAATSKLTAIDYKDPRTDGIEGLTPSSSPMGEGSIYDLQGRKIQNNTVTKSHSNMLPKGIYIYNGRKIVVK